MTKPIEVNQLNFKYKNNSDLTLENINLSVDENEILGTSTQMVLGNLLL